MDSSTKTSCAKLSHTITFMISFLTTEYLFGHRAIDNVSSEASAEEWTWLSCMDEISSGFHPIDVENIPQLQ